MTTAARGGVALRALKHEHEHARAGWRANWLRREPFDWRALLAVWWLLRRASPAA